MINKSIFSVAVSSLRFYSKRPVKLKAKGHSSQEWLRRQMTDPYVEKAKMLSYRCRSFAKLCEIDDKYKILRPGYAVVDCGAAPGSWSQVAVHRCNSDGKDPDKPKGTVIGIDLLPIFPFKVSKNGSTEDLDLIPCYPCRVRRFSTTQISHRKPRNGR